VISLPAPTILTIRVLFSSPFFDWTSIYFRTIIDWTRLKRYTRALFCYTFSMPRLIQKSAQEPQKVGSKFVCMCGLSENQPFCDGSHSKTKGEHKNKLYTYKNGNREEIHEQENCCGSCC